MWAGEGWKRHLPERIHTHTHVHTHAHVHTHTHTHTCTLTHTHTHTLQAVLFVPAAYYMVGFPSTLDKVSYYVMMFTAGISFYTILGQFMVYITPSQQVAQVRCC
jgi:hypothetical protein